MNDLQGQLDYGDAVAEWFLDIGDGHIARGDLDAALKCNYIAGSILSRQNRILSSTRIEANLRLVAGRLAQHENVRPVASRKNGPKEVCLHVVSEALPAGGLTAMTVRWMKNDPDRIHSLALLSQRSPLPEKLLQAVRESGGTVWSADKNDSLLGQAAALRNLANDIASYVILHVDVCDVVSGAAFGAPGGPPVLLVNHAAHIFSNGASFADRILNCRGSALEEFWTASYRGASDYAALPIALPEPSELASNERKIQARESLGIPADAFVLLTVGASFKYAPMDGLDFVEVYESILRELPNAFLLAVGFTGDDRWKSASARVQSRLRTLGVLSQAQLAGIHDAADVYIEGFPFGTTTALLESALKGIPPILAPAQCPPPYASDGIALDHILEQPRTLEEHRDQIIRLSKNPAERVALGEALRNSVAKHHTGLGWKQHLESALRGLPARHSIRASASPIRTPQMVHEHWSRFLPQWASAYEVSLELAMSRALAIGLRPRPTKSIQRVCHDFRALRANRTVPLPLLIAFCNYLLPLLPTAWACNVFRLFAFLCRGSLLPRVGSKLARLFRLVDRPPSAYEEYRRIREEPQSSQAKQ